MQLLFLLTEQQEVFASCIIDQTIMNDELQELLSVSGERTREKFKKT